MRHAIYMVVGCASLALMRAARCPLAYGLCASDCSRAHEAAPSALQRAGSPRQASSLHTYNKTILRRIHLGGSIGAGNAHPPLQATGAIAGPAPPCASFLEMWKLSCSSVRTVRFSR